MPHHCRFHRLLSILALTVFVIGILGSPLTPVQAASAVNTYYATADIVLFPDCTITNPCTLQTAVNNASDGDTIIAKAGTYRRAADQVLHINKSVSIQGGWNGMVGRGMKIDPFEYKTILDGENQRRVVMIDGDASPTLIGVSIYRGYMDEGEGGGVAILNPQEGSVQIEKCWIHDNLSGWYGGGIAIQKGTLTIRNSTLNQNVAANGGGAINAGYGSTVILENNDIRWNTADYGSVGHFDRGSITARSNQMIGNVGNPAVSINSRAGQTIILENNFIGGTEGAAVTLSPFDTEAKSITFLHNTLVNNQGMGLLVPNNTTGTIANNIFQGHKYESLTLGAGSTAEVSHNLYWQNNSDPTLGTNPVLADPLLDSNFRLTYGSPAINAGTGSGIAVDIDGQKRPLGLPDIGADEFSLHLYIPTTMR